MPATFFKLTPPQNPLHNAISTRNDGSACRGAVRRCPVLPPGIMFWLGGWITQRSLIRGIAHSARFRLQNTK